MKAIKSWYRNRKNKELALDKNPSNPFTPWLRQFVAAPSKPKLATPFQLFMSHRDFEYLGFKHQWAIHWDEVSAQVHEKEKIAEQQFLAKWLYEQLPKKDKKIVEARAQEIFDSEWEKYEEALSSSAPLSIPTDRDSCVGYFQFLFLLLTPS